MPLDRSSRLEHRAYGYPMDLAARVALQTAIDFLRSTASPSGCDSCCLTPGPTGRLRRRWKSWNEHGIIELNRKRCGSLAMTIKTEAIYENGMLRLSAPLPFQEHQKVELVINAEPSWTERTAGILRWHGEAEDSGGLPRTMSSVFWGRDDPQSIFFKASRSSWTPTR